MIKSKKQMFLVIGIFTLVMMVGSVTYAFFNYTRTGVANTISVGRIAFVTRQTETINLTNLFPIDPTETGVMDDATKVGTLEIEIEGDTDYNGGIEYLVTASDVNVTTSGKKVPVAIEVGVTSNSENDPATTLGTEETGDYYANRNNYTVSKYKVEYDGNLTNDKHILVGYIAPNTTLGTIEGIDGVITIKAYIDGSKVAISDTYNGSESDNMGTTSDWVKGRTVFTTSEWNSLQSTGISFKVKVEANEGIWVEKPPTPASCFVTSVPVVEYIRNPNMNINTCVSKFTEHGFSEILQEGETLETFCDGTGTAGGRTLQQIVDGVGGDPELESAGIIISTDNYKIGIENYDASCGSDVIIPSTINSELASYTRNPNMNIDTCVSKFTELWGPEEEGYTVDTGETYASYCNGTGTIWGDTLQTWLNEGYFAVSELQELVNVGIITKSVSGTVQANVIAIFDNAFGNKNLTSVAIPNSITMIGYNVFANNNITTMSIDMTNIPENFFNIIRGYSSSYNPSDKLETLVLGEHVQIIGNDAFMDNQLTNVTIPNSVTTIGNNAFFDNQLTNVTIPNSVTAIGSGAFFNNQLTSVTVPNSVSERPWNEGNQCNYFDGDTSVTWNNQTVVCAELGGNY